MFGNHGSCGLLEEGAHGKSPKCLGGNLGDFGEFCKGLLKAEARQRHAVTVGDLLQELEQARAAALAAPTPQSSAAVSATMGKAKMLGLLVDKAEIKAEAEISTKQEEYTPPLTGDEVQQVIKAFFNKPYSEITLEDIIGTVGENTERIGYVITMIIVGKKF